MNYQLVSYGLYNRIESLAVSKKNVEVIYSYYIDNKTISEKIEDVYSIAKDGYLKIDYIEIHLNQIKTIKKRLDLV